MGKVLGTLYVLDQSSFINPNVLPGKLSMSPLVSCNVSSDATHNIVDVTLCHKRFGHASATALHHISFLSKTLFPDLSKCEFCPLAKQHRLSFSPSSIHTVAPFESIHVDLCGPYRHECLSGVRFMLTIVDNFSRATWTYLLSHKSQALTVLTHFTKMVSVYFH